MKLSEQFRFQLQARRTHYGAELPDVIEAGEALADAIDTFGETIAGEIRDGIYTEAGLLERRRTHGAAVLALAQRYEDTAARLDAQTAQSFESAWATLTAPPRDIVEYQTLADVRARLATVDVLIRDRALVHAAGSGQDTHLLRAVLTEPSLGAVVGADGPHLVSDALRTEMQAAITARVGPQGADAWRARELRSMAVGARDLVGITDGLDPIARLAKTGAA